MKELALTIFAAIIGFIASLMTENVQRWVYGPRLRLAFENNNDAYRSCTDIGIPKNADGIYIRLRVENVKSRLAKGCIAYLTRIERMEGHHWHDTNYRDSTQLAWSAQQDGFKPKDLPRGLSQFVDLLYVFNPLPGFQHLLNPRHLQPCLAVNLFQYAPLWATENAHYRLTVLVSGDGVKPKRHRVIIQWNGIWDQINVSDGSRA